MNQKISEIKTYKALFEYVGADFIKEEKYKNKDDLELIIDSYQKALDKKYINARPQEARSLSQTQTISNLYNSRNSFRSINRDRNRFRDRNRERENRDRRDRDRRRRRSRSRSGSRSRRRRSRSRSYSG